MTANLNLRRNLGVGAAALLLLLSALTVGRTQQDWQVTLDTSPLNGQTGYIDLQFNPGGLDALAATITLDHVTTDGSLASMATLTGGASGALPGPPNATLTNATQYNDLFQGITFGNKLQFNAAFSGPALTPTQPLPASGSTFAVSLYDASGSTPLLTASPDGSLMHLDLNPDGTTTATLFADSNGAFHALATPITSSVPEAGSLLSLGVGLSLCLMGRRRRVWEQKGCAG
jgi:hypothetical protein